jgi:glycopeptide antibiotics resistance protein
MNETTVNNKTNLLNQLIFGMGIAFLLFLVWAILWKCSIPFIGGDAERTINLLPFNGNTQWELQFNIAVFVPFGFYLSAAKLELSLLKRVLYAKRSALTLVAVNSLLVILCNLTLPFQFGGFLLL